MNEISTEFYTHIGIKKDKTEILMTDDGVEAWKDAKQEGYGKLIILRDLDGYVTFTGSADLIEEITEIDIKKEQIVELSKRLQGEYEERFLINKSKKTKWTREKLKELKFDEIEYFMDMAKDKLKNSIKKGLSGDKFIKETAMVEMRKFFNCPYK